MFTFNIAPIKFLVQLALPARVLILTHFLQLLCTNINLEKERERYLDTDIGRFTFAVSRLRCTKALGRLAAFDLERKTVVRGLS